MMVLYFLEKTFQRVREAAFSYAKSRNHAKMPQSSIADTSFTGLDV